ncbi:hypothetical protein C1645_745997 [Glomus cerebriforme]|uniref:Uncharacterized protein n=1 Tax=Glomus cerebriforme TaxID=658196 RepID=A0A397S199_9GLOM|nr:hypothetical protein C1645_745997 [Glomus cerebriforme]
MSDEMIFILKDDQVPDRDCESNKKSYQSKALACVQNSGLIMMKNYYEILSYTIPLYPLKEIISEGTLVANIIRKFVYESMIGKVMEEDKNNMKKKNIIDLIRLEIFMKDSFDNISHKTSVNQIFVTKWTGYMMTLISPKIYVMIDIGSVNLSRSFEVCNTFLTGLDMLFAF